MEERREGDSNATTERHSHSTKQSWPSVLREAGRWIDRSDEQLRNADSAMDESLEPDSNVTAERDSQPEKAAAERRSTAAGMESDGRDEQS
jgi:hypothetical protein